MQNTYVYPLTWGIFVAFFGFIEYIQQSLLLFNLLEQGLAQPQNAPYIYTMTSDSIPTIKKRSRPQPRVRESSLEKDEATQQDDEESPVLPCVNIFFLHLQGST